MGGEQLQLQQNSVKSEKKCLLHGFRCLLHMAMDKVYAAQWCALKTAALFHKALHFLLWPML